MQEDDYEYLIALAKRLERIRHTAVGIDKEDVERLIQIAEKLS